MSRLTELLRQARESDPQLGLDLEAEIHALTKRRTFGLVFEPHHPEAVQLPGRVVRQGDKVHLLPSRGKADPGTPQMWRVVRIEGPKENREAHVVEERQTPVAHQQEPERRTVLLEDLVVVAEFRDTIYPGLVETGRTERSIGKPFHTVINGENFHALEMLTYTHPHSIDAIYIDPPYNTGAKDWKYNNNYVESEDAYRHSKWLAFMERRLLLSQRLLNPNSSLLIVTIDEKEYLRLGLLLEQTFPEAKIQMVSSVINRKGVVRTNELTRTNEFIFFVRFGDQILKPELFATAGKVRWASLRRFENSSRRRGPQPRPDQFYPIHIGLRSGRIEFIGSSIAPEVDRETVPEVPETLTVWPLKPDGTEMIWGLTPSTLKKRLEQGFVKVLPARGGKQPTLYYLTSGQIVDVQNGDLIVSGQDDDGSAIVEFTSGKSALPTTQWDRESHNAQPNGTGLLAALLPSRRFPFAKSLFAVEDALRVAVGNKRNAVVLDYFSGSGTTAHAVMRLNRQDGGERQCISVTNNEVSAEEQGELRRRGLRPGDSDWESHGICDYITKPRVTAALTGQTPQGDLVKGDYKFTDEFPMSEGFKENAVFFTLTYESPLSVRHHRAFERVASMLWMRAGSRGRIITDLGEAGWDVAETYAVLENLDQSAQFVVKVRESDSVRCVFVVTNDDSAFQMVCQDLPGHATPIRLYESYLQNFEINTGRSR